VLSRKGGWYRAVKVVKIIGNIFFVLVLAISGLFFLAHFTKVLPLRVFIVSSGSMEPAVKTGGLVVVLPSSSYRIGDVVTYKTGPKDTTTHRLVAAADGQYRTAGDANKAPDTGVIASDQILGKVIYSLPQAGYLAAFAKTPPGFILFVIVPATIIVYEELKALISQIKNKLPSPKIRRGVGGEVLGQGGIHIKPVFVILPIFFAAFILVTVKSISYFSDTETSSQNSFTAFVTTPTPSPTSIPSPTPSPTPVVANHLVISEIQISGDGTHLNDDEFVELYNPTSSPITMSSWRLSRKNSAGTLDTLVLTLNGTVPAHGYFLITDGDGYNGSVTANVNYSAPSNALTNNYTVLLYSDAGITLVDKVGFGPSSTDPEGSTFPSNPSANGSIERKAYSTSDTTSMTSGGDANKGNGFDSDNNSTDFVLRTTSDPQNISSSTETP